MNDEDKSGKESMRLGQKLLASLEKLLSTGDWESSLILRSTRHRLNTLKEKVQKILEWAAKTTTPPEPMTQAKPIKKLPEGFLLVYVSLYQAEGNNLVKWEQTLKALAEYSVSRPVYREETHIQQLIRSKPHPLSQAYVSVVIQKGALIKPYLGKADKDQFGHELLTLREGSVVLDNVDEFVHNGMRYHVQGGRLIRLSTAGVN